MLDREVVLRFVVPADPDLARRIRALLWAYERGRLMHSIQHGPLERRGEDRRRIPSPVGERGAD